ncbi:MAG TPA: low molecular weight protein-tyrosine-phosphatase [Gammaproteobacteria bacterium]|jgi:protein-tyrosine phosphatase|nr:low molecular weight protein-tyrosine-phosphatase [Gammaproteobacteria bacterium]
MAGKYRVSVLFVCMGNICRSPTAEGVFRKLHAELAPELDIHIDSAGTHAYHIGDPPDPRSHAAALKRGMDISSHRGRQARAQDFHDFDYVIAMDGDNLRRLASLRPKDAKAELKLLLEYSPEAGISDVPDPYYGGAREFERVLDLVEQGSRALLEEIRKKHI